MGATPGGPDPMRHALLVLALLLPLAAGLAAPPAAATHVCQPHEPAWTCQHATPEEIVDDVCRKLPSIACRDVALLA